MSSIHQVVMSEHVPGEAFRHAMKGEKVMWVHSPGIVAVGQRKRTREELIADAMSILTIEPGKAPYFWTRERAERAIDRLVGTRQEQAAA